MDYNTERKNNKGSYLSQYKDNMRLFQPLETKLLNKLQHTETFYLFPPFSPLIHHVELKRNS